MNNRIRINGVLYEAVMNESDYREFNHNDYRNYSCEEFADGSKPLIHEADNGVDVILYPNEDAVDGLRDNSSIGIYYYVDETGQEYTWNTQIAMSKSEALGEFDSIIKLVDRVHGESVDIINGLHRIGKRFYMVDDILNL